MALKSMQYDKNRSMLVLPAPGLVIILVIVVPTLMVESAPLKWLAE